MAHDVAPGPTEEDAREADLGTATTMRWDQPPFSRESQESGPWLRPPSSPARSIASLAELSSSLPRLEAPPSPPLQTRPGRLGPMMTSALMVTLLGAMVHLVLGCV